MDKVSKKFDEWAINGKAESMEKGHGKNVLKFLKLKPSRNADEALRALPIPLTPPAIVPAN